MDQYIYKVSFLNNNLTSDVPLVAGPVQYIFSNLSISYSNFFVTEEKLIYWQIVWISVASVCLQVLSRLKISVNIFSWVPSFSIDMSFEYNCCWNLLEFLICWNKKRDAISVLLYVANLCFTKHGILTLKKEISHSGWYHSLSLYIYICIMYWSSLSFDRDGYIMLLFGVCKLNVIAETISSLNRS